MRIKIIVLALMAVITGVFSYTRPHNGVPSDLRDAVSDKAFDALKDSPGIEASGVSVPELVIKPSYVETVSRRGLSNKSYVSGNDNSRLGRTVRSAVAEDTLHAAEEIAGAPVSEEFSRKVEFFIQQIPAPYRIYAQKQGVRFIVTPVLSKWDTENAGNQLRGWGADSIIDNTDCIYSDEKRVVVLAEYFVPRRNSSVKKSIRIRGNVFHEFSHALDHVSGNISRSVDYGQAYEKDLKDFTREDRVRLGYLVDNGVEMNGRDEAFAEVCAILLGGEGNYEEPAYTLAKFPTTAAWIKIRLKNY